MKLFGLELGKKKAAGAAEAEAPPATPKKEKAKKEKAPKAAKPAKPKAAGRGGELNVYTGVLLAAFLVLGAGAALLAKTNMDAVAGTADDGNPFAVMPER